MLIDVMKSTLANPDSFLRSWRLRQLASVMRIGMQRIQSFVREIFNVTILLIGRKAMIW